MGAFANESNIELQKIAPQRPSSNPAETFMWPLGQAMKIAHMNKNSEKETLNQLLNNYGDTPHTATGLPPAAMLFRDGKWTVFPRKIVTYSDVSLARERDKRMTQERTGKINTSSIKNKTKLTSEIKHL